VYLKPNRATAASHMGIEKEHQGKKKCFSTICAHVLHVLREHMGEQEQDKKGKGEQEKKGRGRKKQTEAKKKEQSKMALKKKKEKRQVRKEEALQQKDRN